MSIIRWEDPPPANSTGRTNAPRRTAFWRAVAAQLREAPGRWALVCDEVEWNYAGGTAGQITGGRLAAFRPPGSFEAITRTAYGYRVYARYIGDPS